jgi:hypothetical protein
MIRLYNECLAATFDRLCRIQRDLPSTRIGIDSIAKKSGVNRSLFVAQQYHTSVKQQSLSVGFPPLMSRAKGPIDARVWAG